ncbi:SAM-dependent DNA methyltransferase [Vibrio vulnificus]|nr:SAM-dependent DNA methyltransferase [Vibrio vulnificus]EHU4867581.1 SAM-dependent DNA methyltransferase [Vibrio vulnificus]EHV9036696.1 SAM-dependent DNA methyltransferase [Vibrio vulnificus]EIA1323160.1 SAM-dependent DNA methyltransferase [Vibrio vulnificus]EIT7120842.1 SAM-dependent DNA methyltransferase [Vibrio vulnificus]
MNTEQLKKLEKDLWSAADNLRANSDLKSSEYATPVLGLIFLKFADNKYSQVENDIVAEHAKLKGSRREKSLSDVAIEKCGFYLPEHSRYDYLLNLPEEQDIDIAIKKAMEGIEEYKESLEGVLPKDEYFALTRTDRTLPAQLLKTFSDIPRDATGDILGKIYEFFLGKFALAEGQGGGVFYTPTSVVRLMVEIIEPYKGTVYDPACGSAGMFVQSQQFIQDHRTELEALGESYDENQLFVYGQEKTLDTVKLAKMNIAVNGLRGDIKQANSYKENPFDSYCKFDYVLANPPFNVDDVPLADVEEDIRFNKFGLPKKKTKAKKKDEGKETVPNANYLWINLFATSLKDKGRAALVMANSASDARHSEADIRQRLIEENLIYGMLTLPSNMFYTVTLPATLWFFDHDKQDDRILFIDARNVFTQLDRAHREFSPEQISNLAIISKLHKGKRREFVHLIDSYFAKGMTLLAENKVQVEPVGEQILEVLDDVEGKLAVGELVKQWSTLTQLQAHHKTYTIQVEGKFADKSKVDELNAAQHELQRHFEPFFKALHQGLKQIDKTVRKHEKAHVEKAKAKGKRATTDRQTKQLKVALEQLHKEVKSAESYFKHIYWLQERFPEAEYEDITGLCKLASPEEVKEQDYSLNPGRYVGVVIEEDGKTEEEFVSELDGLHDHFVTLSKESRNIESILDKNIAVLTGEA